MTFLGVTLDERYEILSEVGEGGMATVYEALDHRLSRRVAVKILHAQFAESAELSQRFHQEAAIAAKLEYPNIVQVYDYGTTDDGRAYIVSELIRGIDFHRIQVRYHEKNQAPVPVPLTLLVCDQALRGLGAVHSQGYVHRDVKPDNILVAYDGTVKLTDFGIAKDDSQRMTKVGRFLGSPIYSAPEQVEGRAVDLRSDLFAFGIILYEALTGTLPFNGETASEVMKKIVVGSYRSPQAVNPDIDLPLVGIIARALKSKPEERYNSVDEILADLHPVLRLYGLKGERVEVSLFFKQPADFKEKFQKRVKISGPVGDRPTRSTRPDGARTRVSRRASPPMRNRRKDDTKRVAVVRTTARATLPFPPQRRPLLWGIVTATLLLLGLTVLLGLEKFGVWSVQKWLVEHINPGVSLVVRAPVPARIPAAEPIPTEVATVVPEPTETPERTPVPVDTPTITATPISTLTQPRPTPKPTVRPTQRLTPQPTPPVAEARLGVLTFRTIPSGAPVFVDGKQIAPDNADEGLIRQELKAGNYTIRVGNTDVGGVKYLGMDTQVRVKAGAVRDLGLVKLKALRALTIIIRGSEVKVKVNGERHVLSRGPLVLNLPEGKVRIEARAVNGKTLRRTIVLRGEDFTLNASLE